MAEAGSGGPAEEAGPAKSDKAPFRVLVLDDIPEILALFEDAARRTRRQGIELVTEADGRRALERAGSEPFDLIVSDYRMKGADGIEVLTLARRLNPRGYRVLMTGYNEIPTALGRILEASVDAYVQKPFGPLDIIHVLLAFRRGDDAIIEGMRQDAREIEAMGALEEMRSA